MASEIVVSITGIILSLLCTWGVFILTGIKRSQDNTNKEIKEMNKDIRDLLIQMGKNDEKFKSVSQQIIEIHDSIKGLTLRLQKLEID